MSFSLMWTEYRQVTEYSQLLLKVAVHHLLGAGEFLFDVDRIQASD